MTIFLPQKKEDEINLKINLMMTMLMMMMNLARALDKFILTILEVNFHSLFTIYHYLILKSNRRFSRKMENERQIGKENILGIQKRPKTNLMVWEQIQASKSKLATFDIKYDLLGHRLNKVIRSGKR